LCWFRLPGSLKLLSDRLRVVVVVVAAELPLVTEGRVRGAL
jgi:hypothetical protein